MSHTIQLTTEQFQALQSGQPITIEPPKSAITKWEPKGGKFLISGALDSSYPIENKHNEYSASGLRYQTKDKANSVAKQLRAYARQLAYLAENDDGWVADWSNSKQDKYHIYIGHNSNEIKTYRNCTDQSIGVIYMSSTNATKLAQLMNDGIVEF